MIHELCVKRFFSYLKKQRLFDVVCSADEAEIFFNIKTDRQDYAVLMQASAS